MKQLEIRFGVPAPAHGPQHSRGGMLERQVEVRQEPGVFGHDIEDTVRKVVGMDVEKPDPVVAGDAGYLGEQQREPRLAEIAAVRSQVLGNEHELAYAAVEKLPRLLDHLYRPPAGKITADEGNGAIRAAVSTPFGDFQIRTPGKGEQVLALVGTNAGRLAGTTSCPSQELDDS